LAGSEKKAVAERALLVIKTNSFFRHIAIQSPFAARARDRVRYIEEHFFTVR
jgi:hypothetical protein